MEALSDSYLMFQLTTDNCSLHTRSDLAGAEGFEPPSSVLETDSLTVELTPLKAVASGPWLVIS